MTPERFEHKQKQVMAGDVKYAGDAKIDTSLHRLWPELAAYMGPVQISGAAYGGIDQKEKPGGFWESQAPPIYSA